MTTDAQLMDMARQLACALKDSQAYARYAGAVEAAQQKPGLWPRLEACQRQVLHIRALQLAGEDVSALADQLQKDTLALQYDPVAQEVEMARYALNALIGQMYALLGQAVGIDMTFADGEG
nr:YlbF family regulator [bacterium]